MWILATFVSLGVVSVALGQSCEESGGACIRQSDVCEGTVNSALQCQRKRRRCCVPNSGGGGGSPEDIIPGYANCGVRLNSRNRIVGGQQADEHEWPWQASLWSLDWDMHVCGASVIHPQWAVTASHCVVGSGLNRPQDLKLVFGEHHQGENSGREVVRFVTKIITHEDYRDSAPWPNDIALLKLDEPLQFNEHVNLACLAAPSDGTFAGQNCWITGWGDTKGTGNEEILNEIRLPVRSNSDCEQLWGSQYILGGHVCIGNGDTGSCQGDSGGPMVCVNNGRHLLAGVTSWGVTGCQTEGRPVVYTRVSEYQDWILNKLSTY